MISRSRKRAFIVAALASFLAAALLMPRLWGDERVLALTPQTDSIADSDLSLAAAAAGSLISEETEITFVGAEGKVVLGALTESERVFGDDQESFEAMRLVVVHVPSPTRGVDYSRPPGTSAESIVSALLVIDPSGNVIASELATPSAEAGRDMSRMELMGDVRTAVVEPLP